MQILFNLFSLESSNKDLTNWRVFPRGIRQMERRRRIVRKDQRDQICRYFTTLARCYYTLAILKRRLNICKKIGLTLNIFFKVLGKCLVLQWQNIKPIHWPSGHTVKDQNKTFKFTLELHYLMTRPTSNSDRLNRRRARWPLSTTMALLYYSNFNLPCLPCFMPSRRRLSLSRRWNYFWKECDQIW